MIFTPPTKNKLSSLSLWKVRLWKTFRDPDWETYWLRYGYDCLLYDVDDSYCEPKLLRCMDKVFDTYIVEVGSEWLRENLNEEEFASYVADRLSMH